jgi:hypothetical protein
MNSLEAAIWIDRAVEFLCKEKNANHLEILRRGALMQFVANGFNPSDFHITEPIPNSWAGQTKSE